MGFKMKGLQFAGTKEGKDLLKQHKDIKTVRSSDVGRVGKKFSKFSRFKNIFRVGPAAAISILGAAGKLNIKGRGSDAYQKRKRNYMDLGKSQLNKK